jgi:hypothetical protein
VKNDHVPRYKNDETRTIAEGGGDGKSYKTLAIVSPTSSFIRIFWLGVGLAPFFILPVSPFGLFGLLPFILELAPTTFLSTLSAHSPPLNNSSQFLINPSTTPTAFPLSTIARSTLSIHVSTNPGAKQTARDCIDIKFPLILATSRKCRIINDRMEIDDSLNTSIKINLVSFVDKTTDRGSDSVWKSEEGIKGGDDRIICFKTPQRISGGGEVSRRDVSDPVETNVAI